MRTRLLLPPLAIASVLLAGLLAPTTAQAASSPKTGTTQVEDCSVLDTSPGKVSIGLKPVTVQFDVGTDCDDEDHTMEWAVRGAYFPTSHVSWFGACTYSYLGPDVFVCPDGRTKLDVVGDATFKGNKMAGPQKVFAYAFDDENGDDQISSGESLIEGESSITLLRRTTWGTTFNASPEPRRKGQTLKITGQVSRANWDTGTYQKFGAYVKLQFRAEGKDEYKNVRTVWDDGASATTKVKAVSSGSYRYYYPGDATHAPSASKADFVKVLPAKKKH